jgi:hypothetical protein
MDFQGKKVIHSCKNSNGQKDSSLRYLTKMMEWDKWNEWMDTHLNKIIKSLIINLKNIPGKSCGKLK